MTEQTVPTRFKVGQASQYGKDHVGLYATTRIARGEIVLSEEPILLLRAASTGPEMAKSQENLMKAVASLSAPNPRLLRTLAFKHAKASGIIRIVPGTKPSLPVEIRDFDKLARLGPDQTSIEFKSLILNTFFAYSAPFLEEEKADIHRLCAETLCFVNHSCKPNAAVYWDSTLGHVVIRATSDIDTEDEITISYIPDPFSPKADRRSALGFECRCQLCSRNIEGVENFYSRLAFVLKRLNAANILLLDPPLPDDMRIADWAQVCKIVDLSLSNDVKGAVEQVMDIAEGCEISHVSLAPSVELLSAVYLAKYLVQTDHSGRDEYLKVAINAKEWELKLLVYALGSGDTRCIKARQEFAHITLQAPSGSRLFEEGMKKLGLDA